MASDLKSDENCIQQTEMSLMAEKVLCNEQSTLITNLILRIDPSNKATNELWAVEYEVASEHRCDHAKCSCHVTITRSGKSF